MVLACFMANMLLQSIVSIGLWDFQWQGLGLSVLLGILNAPQFSGHQSLKHPNIELSGERMLCSFLSGMHESPACLASLGTMDLPASTIMGANSLKSINLSLYSFSHLFSFFFLFLSVCMYVCTKTGIEEARNTLRDAYSGPYWPDVDQGQSLEDIKEVSDGNQSWGEFSKKKHGFCSWNSLW